MHYPIIYYVSIVDEDSLIFLETSSIKLDIAS